MSVRQAVVDRFINDIARELDAESAHIANIDAAAFRINASADRAQIALATLYPDDRAPHGSGFFWTVVAYASVVAIVFGISCLSAWWTS